MIKCDNLLNVDWAVEDRKRDLTDVEYRGLESILKELVVDYEEKYFGEVYSNIEKVTVYRDDTVDLSEGYDMFDFEINRIMLFERGAVAVECLRYDAENDEEEYFMMRVN